jgi:hypothetical protein
MNAGDAWLDTLNDKPASAAAVAEKPKAPKAPNAAGLSSKSAAGADASAKVKPPAVKQVVSRDPAAPEIPDRLTAKPGKSSEVHEYKVVRKGVPVLTTPGLIHDKGVFTKGAGVTYVDINKTCYTLVVRADDENDPIVSAVLWMVRPLNSRAAALFPPSEPVFFRRRSRIWTRTRCSAPPSSSRPGARTARRSSSRLAAKLS